jgi:hypothetical protein
MEPQRRAGAPMKTVLIAFAVMVAVLGSTLVLL